MAERDERIRVLEMIERGEISAVDGLRLLEELSDEQAPDAAPISPQTPPGEKNVLKEGAVLSPVNHRRLQDAGWQPESGPAAQDAAFVEADRAPRDTLGEAEKWRRWQKLPLWGGLGLTLLTMGGLFAIFSSVGIGLLFLCAWIPFLLGLLLLGVGWFTRDAPWLHLRVQQKPGETPQRIAFSLPLPVRPLAWLVRNFGHLIPALQETSVDEILLALSETTSPENPIYIQVDEGEDGEKVEIFIG